MKIHDATLLTSITCNIYILRLPTYLRPFTSPSISTQLPRVLFVPVNLLQGRTLLAEMLLPSIYALIVASSCLQQQCWGKTVRHLLIQAPRLPRHSHSTPSLQTTSPQSSSRTARDSPPFLSQIATGQRKMLLWATILDRGISRYVPHLSIRPLC